MRDGFANRPIGRDAELHVINAFLVAASHGPAGLVLEGPAGIGKSTLAAATIEEARKRGYRVLTARPSGAEVAWAYQSLADLLVGVGEDAVESLPTPQRQAIDIALLRGATPAAADAATHARAISVGTVNALISLSRTAPVALVIDDAPWLDPASSSALAFVVRRMGAHPIGVLVTQRVETPGPVPLDLDQAITTERAWLAPMSFGALHLLLVERLGLTLPRPTLMRLHEISRGNPFHALEIGRALQRLPALPLPGEPLPIPDSLRGLIRGHLATVGEETRATLLVAAAAGSPSVDELRKAAGPGTDSSIEEAADVGLLAIDGGVVRFSHPSLALAVYEDATPAARRRAHAALAEAVEEPEARGRHLALATVVPDPAVAAALEDAALDAKRRGAAETAAELSRLAVERTPPDDEPARQRRTLLLATLLTTLPDLPTAEKLVLELIPTLPPGSARAEARMLAGTIAWYTRPEPHPAVAQLEAALPDAASFPELLGRLHYRLSVFSDFDLPAAARHAAAARDILVGAAAPITLAAAMFELFAITVALGDPPDLGLFEAALAIEGENTHFDQSTVPGIWWIAVDRPDLARARFQEMLDRTHAAGEASADADLLTRLAETELYADRWDLALELADEATMTAQQEGQPIADPARRVRALIEAHMGRLDEARAAATAGLDRAEELGDSPIAASYLLVLGHVAAAEGKMADVEQLADRSAGHLASIGKIQPLRLDLTPERVEALVALRRLDEAESHLERFVMGARIVPRPWAEAAIARGRARLLAARGRPGDAVTATDPTTDSRSSNWRRFDRARTLLVRGEILRQMRSRRDAGDALDAALRSFDELGARVWAGRARAELERLGRHRPGTEDLTPTERRVAELAASGMRNREVADELGISAKTVEAHLAHIYAKLAIRSRAELGRAFAAGSPGDG
jgi:DNA-binding CsgD family transcriptional regulator